MVGSTNTVVHSPKLSKIIAISIGVVLSVPTLIFGFYLFQSNMTSASNAVPRDVVISEIGMTNGKISWTTDEEVQSVIEYGTSPSALVFYAPESKKTKDHHVDLDLLTPRTTHYFRIRVEDQIYDNAGSPWTFITKSNSSDKVATASATNKAPTQPAQLFPTTIPTITVVITPAASCKETDCRKIQQNFGKGCTVTDYIKCLNASINNPTATPSAGTSIAATPTVTPVQKPDLTIADINGAAEFCISAEEANANVTFTLTIKNQGNVKTGDHYLKIDFNPSISDDDEGNEYTRLIDVAIDPNSSYTVTDTVPMTSCTKCSEGHSAEFIIDSEGKVGESNESNNKTSEPIRVCES